MATVKVKFRPSSVEGKAGTIYYQITHRRIIRQITTDIHILPEYWNAEQQRIVLSASDSITLQSRIDSGILLLQSITKTLEASGSEYTVDDIVKRYRTGNNHVLILAFMQEQIDYMRRCNRYGTAKNYEHTMHSFSQFLGDDIPFAAISEQLIDNYNAFLVQRGIVRNSVSFYIVELAHLLIEEDSIIGINGYGNDCWHYAKNIGNFIITHKSGIVVLTL